MQHKQASQTFVEKRLNHMIFVLVMPNTSCLPVDYSSKMQNNNTDPLSKHKKMPNQASDSDLGCYKHRPILHHSANFDNHAFEYVHKNVPNSAQSFARV